MSRSHDCSYSTDVLQIKDLVKTNEIKKIQKLPTEIDVHSKK